MTRDHRVHRTEHNNAIITSVLLPDSVNWLKSSAILEIIQINTMKLSPEILVNEAVWRKP